MFHVLTLYKCVQSTQSVSPRKPRVFEETRDSLKVNYLPQKHPMLCLSVLLPYCAAFRQTAYSLSYVVLFFLFLKTCPSGFYSVHPFFSDLPSSPRILFFSPLPNSPYFDHPVKLGQPYCPCPPVLGVDSAIADYSVREQPVATVGPVSWRSWAAAKPETTDVLLTIDS